MRPVVRRVGAVAVTLAVVGGGYAAYAAAAEPTAAYRTATVTRADVQETLSLSGTLTPVGRAELAFGTDGTLAALPVAAGSSVTTGQVVARLDTRDLRRAVNDAASDVAAAKAQLESDEDAQADTVSDATTTTTADASSGASQPTQQTQQQSEQESEQESEQPSQDSTPAEEETEEPADESTTSTPDVAAAMATALAQLAAQQEAVTSAQSASSSAITDAKQALAAQTTACEDAFTPDPVDPEPSDGASDGASEQPQTDSADAACTTALGRVQDAQDAVATAQDALQAALEALTSTLSAAVDTLTATVQSAADSTSGQTSGQTSGESSGSTQGQADQGQSGEDTQDSQQQGQQSTTQQPATSSGSASSGSASSGSASGGSASSGSASSESAGMTQTVTAATLARDQASIDEAKAELIAARQSLASATLRAPYAGTVADVAVEEGADTTAGTTVVTVIAEDTITVEIAATEAQVRRLATGQVASVVPVGSEETLSGEVTAIGAVPDTSTGTATYPVTVTLDGRDLALPTGATASVAVVVGTAEDVLSVPSSAVSSGSVQVVEEGTAARTPVETGIVGSTRTEITSGLQEGQEVSLADLSAALPSADTDTATTLGSGGGLGGGFGGTGGGPPTGGRG